MKEISIHDIEGFKIGHAQDLENGTGCTVILNEEGATGGVDVRGGGPATRDTDLLDPRNTVEKVNGVLLGGGSAFGLCAATGVMEYLSEKNIGFPVGDLHVPIVVQADIFDLAVGKAVWTDEKMAYEACLNAENPSDELGNIGCGTGASVGKMLGMEYAMKSGLGMYAGQQGDLQVGAVVAVNACADVYMPDSEELVASVYRNGPLKTEDLLLAAAENLDKTPGKNTTIACIITNADFSKAKMNKLASMCHDAYARVIRPCHLETDGDTIFTMSSNKVKADLNVVAVMAQKVLMEAIIKGVKAAKPAYGLESYQSVNEKKVS